MKKTVLVFLLLISGSMTMLLLSQTPIFINEIHYDNSSTDVNEGVEVAGPASTDMTGWTLVFYNGSNGTSYATENITGTISDQQNGYGTIWVAHAGVQNGSPDGVALVNASTEVVQFLSYEGEFTATDGPANGMTSTDIGVVEGGGTGTDQSIQLTGQGEEYEDFIWMADLTATNGAVNTNQIFGTLPEPDNHATGFTIDSKTFSRISLTWTDAVGTNLPTGYLIKAVQGGSTISPPVDGIPEYDSKLVRNILPGTQTVLFSTLDGNTLYNFEIYPYSNSNELIDYKTDGTIPTAMETTDGSDTIILFTDFEYDPEGWFPVSDSGDNQEWDLTDPGADGTYRSAYISGFNYDGDVNQDWAFSPPTNLDAWSDEVLTFYNRWQYGNNDDINYLKLFYSTDYNGEEGMHNEATWTELAFDSSATAETWFMTSDIDLSGISGQNVRFGFKYKSGDVRFDNRSWWIDEFLVKGTFTGETVPPEWKTEFPKTDDVREYQLDVVGNINEAGSIYFLVKDDGAPAPSKMEVMMGDTLVVVNGGQDYSTTVDGLTAKTAYDIYFIAADALGNVQDTTVLVEATTLDARVLELTHPVGGETFYVGDSATIKWASENIDSIKLYSWSFENELWYDFLDSAIVASADSLPIMVALDAGVDSTIMKIEDASDPTFFDSSGTFYLIDTIVPVLDSINPKNGATDADPTTEIVLWFNEMVYPGSGYILVKEEGSDCMDSIDVKDLQPGRTIAFQPVTPCFPFGTTFNMKIDSGAFVDFQGNAWEGIDYADWRVTTVAPVEVANLAGLRAATADNKTVYKVTGEVVVTGFMDYRGRKYLQDATGAIEIDDNNLKAVTTVYSIGDGITGLTGTLEDYFDWLEIHPIVDPGEPTSTGNTITPKTITIADFKANFNDHAAQLIKIDTVALDATGQFGNGDEIDISRDNDTSILKVNFYDTDLTGTDIPENANITGIAYWHYDEAKITPRFAADVEEVIIIIDNVSDLQSNGSMKVYPNPSSGLITLEMDMEAASDLEIEVYSLNGKMVYRKALRSVIDVQEQLNLNDLERGMYMLRVRSKDGIFMRKLVIQ